MYIRKNSEIRNEQDLQNLVTSIILRQTKSFVPEIIEGIVKFYLRDSEFYHSYKLISKLVDETLDLFQRRNLVARYNGVFYPQDVFSDAFIPEYYRAIGRKC